jgi:hypothetical protein
VSGAQVNLAGAEGDDAHRYQERAVRDAIAQSQRAEVEERDVTDR